MVFKDTFRVDVFMDFLKRMLRQIKRKIFLIVDGHTIHPSIHPLVTFENCLEKNTNRIRIFLSTSI